MQKYQSQCPLPGSQNGHVAQACANSLRSFWNGTKGRGPPPFGWWCWELVCLGVAVTMFQPQAERWAVTEAQWGWTTGSRVYMEEGWSVFEDQISFNLNAQTPTNLPAVYFSWLFCLHSFEYRCFLDSYIPHRDGVQDWFDSNWPGMWPLREKFSSPWWNVCWILAFVYCFEVYQMLFYLLSHFIFTTALGDKQGREGYPLLTEMSPRAQRGKGPTFGFGL